MTQKSIKVNGNNNPMGTRPTHLFYNPESSAKRGTPQYLLLFFSHFVYHAIKYSQFITSTSSIL